LAKPVILTVDDEVQVSNAIERDLKSKFSKQYSIIKTYSGAEALSTVDKLKQRDMQVALFLTDQRMPEMEGTEFLEQAIKIYPNARRVLLTAYADTDAAIQSINTLGVDYYLMKPWDPPEEKLFPVLRDLLIDWVANNLIINMKDRDYFVTAFLANSAFSDILFRWHDKGDCIKKYYLSKYQETTSALSTAISSPSPCSQTLRRTLPSKSRYRT
jgi:CheY-like chemotaxis protein